jgi:hypothetical protein
MSIHESKYVCKIHQLKLVSGPAPRLTLDRRTPERASQYIELYYTGLLGGEVVDFFLRRFVFSEDGEAGVTGATI